MRAIIKRFIIDTVSLYLVSQIVSGMLFEQGIETLLFTGLVLMLTTLIVKPVINVLLLPLNLVTFGLFKWVAYAITFYIVTLVVPGFRITGFAFSGYETYWFSIPAIKFFGSLAFIAFGLVISFVSSIMYWIFK